MKDVPTVYTEYHSDGTVRMSLHPFNADFGYSKAPNNFGFEHRVVVRPRNARDGVGNGFIQKHFHPSCYSSLGVYQYENSEEEKEYYAVQLRYSLSNDGSEDEFEATKHLEFAALNWLLDGEQ